MPGSIRIRPFALLPLALVVGVVALVSAREGEEARPAAADDEARRGLAILSALPESLPDYSGNALTCTNCHLDGGRRPNAMPWVGVARRYPQYRAREGREVSLADRINGCLRRSMNGRALPDSHPALRAMLAYMERLSADAPPDGKVAGQGLPKIDPPLEPDTARGRALYAAECARCHGGSGEGTVIVPPLWGPRSFNIGAGMARLRTAAAFVRLHMPYDRPGTLDDQQAFDVAGYVVSRPRPDLPGKELDWPNGDPPPDVAYPTRAAERRRAAASSSPTRSSP